MTGLGVHVRRNTQYDHQLKEGAERQWVNENHQLPRTRRCKLLNLPRYTSCYQPKPISDDDLALMKRIDRIFTQTPLDFQQM